MQIINNLHNSSVHAYFLFLVTARNFRKNCNPCRLIYFLHAKNISLLWFQGECDSDRFMTGSVNFTHFFCSVLCLFGQLQFTLLQPSNALTLPMVHLSLTRQHVSLFLARFSARISAEGQLNSLVTQISDRMKPLQQFTPRLETER